jgi:hypothetical protein
MLMKTVSQSLTDQLAARFAQRILWRPNAPDWDLAAQPAPPQTTD